MKKKRSLLFGLILLFTSHAYAQQIISDKKIPNSFSIDNAVIYVDANDLPLVKRSAGLFQQDIEMVTGKKIQIVHNITGLPKKVIVIGSAENSSLITAWVKQAKIRPPKKEWEAYCIQSVKNPDKNTEDALVICGNDRRGVAYGVFELSKQIGVSPWYWWADVPVKKSQSIYIKTAVVINDAPKVKYRGIFINDEAPAFSGWTKEKFGGVNHQVYEKIFELILRLKGNYLWPAMWGNAFNDDDTLNPVKADEWGIIMGTSHHEPMLRAQQEWKRYGSGKWDYDSNEVTLKTFWKKGMENMGSHESIVTVGMRGDGDKPMTEGTATTLLERIVKDQRQIIEEVTGKPAAETPQLWALYKEVQDYYDKGMRVPDDVTLLLCDDNWGNIRKLPKLNETSRKGGYGIYYHFDYVGGPRNYKWLNTNPIPRVWEQMHLAWEYNARQIWIVNVGDIKPMEFPISFFLDYAWNPEKIGAADLQKYTEQWCAAQFGEKHAEEIARITSGYLKLNGRRKPELLDQDTYSIDNYHEFENAVKEYKQVLTMAEYIEGQLPAGYKDAYFQLVLHPVKAMANLYNMYYNAALNRFAYKNRYAVANEYADKVKQLYANDSLISLQYNRLNNGKWNHMMDQTHIGYTYWQQPQQQKMPDVKYVSKDSVLDEPERVSSDERNAVVPSNEKGNVFFEKEGCVSMEAAHYTRTTDAKGNSIKILPDLGRTGSAVTVFPVTMAPQTLVYGAPKLEYEMYVYDTGAVKIQAYFSPTLNFHNDEGLRYAVAIDDELPQVIPINKDDNNVRTWEKWVAANIIIRTTDHRVLKPGKHILKCWMMNPAIVLQKIVVDLGGVKPSYLGPPETRIK